MANEIQLTIQLTATNGAFRRSFTNGSQLLNQASPRADSHVQVIGTSAEAITVASDVATFGYAAFRNLDATNYVDVGPDSAGTLVPMMRLKPGESASLRLTPGITLKAQANTASVPLDILILGD